MSVEGPSPAASALAKSLALSQMLAGQVVQSAGTLESPVRSVSQPAPAGKCADGDCVEISPEARALAEATERGGEAAAAAESGGEQSGGAVHALALSREEQAILRDLQSRDAEVRAHENAHAAAGGAAAGAPSYTYEKGPDGRQYAVGGEVPIAVQKGATPEETLQNAARVRAAALAPADPSSADRNVAASASALEMEARQEIAERELAAERGEADPASPATTDAAGAGEAAGPAAATSTGTAAPEVDARVRAYEPVEVAALEPQRLDLFG